jgi:PAP2 superfamily
MRRTALLGILMPVSVGLAGVAPVTGNGLATVQADHASMVVDWNLTMLSTFASVNLPPPVASRDGAIVQAAVFDAVNGIEPRYTPIHVAPTAPHGASRAAAAANAAYTSLVSLFPAQKVSLDAALQASLGTITEDEEDDNRSIALGLAWGKTVADDIVAWRAGDGFSTPSPPYNFGTALGDWQPTPDANGVPGSGPPKFRSLATTVPFALTSPSQFRPAGPPALSSARYAQDYNEVKSLGSKTGSARSAFQTQTAVFWQVDTPLAMWDRVADMLAEHHRNSLLESARVLALVNLALADATIAIWDAKNAFNSWRPVTAINTAGGFGNSATTPEPGWLPLLATPYFQEYPSAHAGVSSAAASVLATIFGQHATFTVTSAGLPGVVRTFNSFNEAVAQVADARVYAGFHFRFSCDVAIQMGEQVAGQVESKLMRRLHGAPENEGD